MRIIRSRRMTGALGIAIVALPLLFAPLGYARATRRDTLELVASHIELPGPPSAIVPADLDGDGEQDLLVVLAYTELDELGYDRVEGMVQISTVIPALFDRREARAFLAGADGRYRGVGAPLPLPDSVLAVAQGTEALPVLALTDGGIAVLRWNPTRQALELEPLIEDRPLLAGCGAFFARLEWAVDLDGDGDRDVLLPSVGGPTVYRTEATGLSAAALQRIESPVRPPPGGPHAVAGYAVPRVADVDGDGAVDMTWIEATGSGSRVYVLAGSGDGTFHPAGGRAADCVAGSARLVVRDSRGAVSDALEHLRFFGDVDGEGRAEAVVVETFEPRGDGLRAGLKQTRRPRAEVRLHRVRDDLSIDAEPYARFPVTGHVAMDFELTERAAPPLRDLDGDGRLDLVAVTLDFSLFQAVRVLTTKRISIGLDFHVWAQTGDGRFEPVEGLDLSEKLRFDLDDLELGRMAQFAGDFDGDGRIDFVHLGRGREVTVHLGRPGCRYAPKPDLVLVLDEEPADLGLVRIRDLDGDGRSDLSITRPLPSRDADVSAPVRLDLYLSGARR